MKWLQMRMKQIFGEESGIATVEIVLILVVLIALILVFKTQIGKIMDSVFLGMDQQIQEVYR